MINKITIVIFILIMVFVISVAMPSCGHSTPSFVDKSVVQVWRSDSNGGAKILEALGVAVGDGTTVLTVINYEDYSPGQIEAVSPKYGKFAATIQAIDSRSGATLLKLSNGRLPAVTTGDATTLNTGDKLTVWGQIGSDTTLRLTKIMVQVVPWNISTLGFNVVLTDSTPYPIGHEEVDVQGQGMVITDQSGKVVGLISAVSNRLTATSGGVGHIPPIITINSALELLSPNANNQPWANGPILFVANESGSRSGNYNGIVRDYVPVAMAITKVLSQLGGALSIADLPQDFRSYVWDNEISETSDGSLLTTVFPQPVELRDSIGNLLTDAKWVGIQWDRNDGKPSRVVYGSTAYIVSGSFEIMGDASSLKNAVRTLLNDPTPYGQ
jgi:hypothetical protein